MPRRTDHRRSPHPPHHTFPGILPPVGNFYTNITLRGGRATQAAAVELLRSLDREAYVTADDAGVVVVYDAQCEDQDVQILSDLARDLSRELDCVALAALNHDDDLLILELWEQGDGVDEYNSNPAATSDYDALTEDDEGPAGGDPEALAELFDVEDRTDGIEAVLTQPGNYTFAFMQHLALAKLLGIPEEFVVAGFNTLSSGDLVGALNPDDLMKVG